MELVRYSYFPGWTMGDYTNWDATVDESGLLRQHMNPEDGKTKRKHGVDIRERHLSAEELAEVHLALEGFDTSVCSYFDDLGICIDDVEIIDIESKKYGFRYSGPLLTLRQMARRGDRDISTAKISEVYALWKLIDRLCPNPQQARKTTKR